MISWPSSLARGRGVGHQEVGVPHWTLLGQEMLGTHGEVPVQGWVARPSAWGQGVGRGSKAIGIFRVSRTSLDTQSFSTWKSCFGSTRECFSGLLGFPVTHSPSHPSPAASSALPHPRGQPTPHSLGMSYWVPQSPSLGKRPSCESFHFPNQMRHKKQ